jgi:hypothetical protein
MADNKWYDSKRGWVAAVIGAAYWVLDHWGRIGTAVEMYQKMPGWFLILSPYLGPLLFLIAVVFFEIRRRSGPNAQRSISKKVAKKKEVNWRLVSYVAVIVAFVAASAWIISRPNMHLVVRSSSIGEERGAGPIGGVILAVSLNNVGPPTTTSNWKLTLKLRNGESVEGVALHKDVWAYVEGIEQPYIRVLATEFISSKTEHAPMPPGGAESGYLAFAFPGLTRDRINDLGNVLTVGWQDARSTAYEADYQIPAKMSILYPPPRIQTQ